MEHEVSYNFEDEDQFWTALEETISRECTTHDSIDDTLRSYIELIGSCRGRFLPTDNDLGRCAFKLQESSLFTTHADYIRRQFIQCLIEDDEPNVVLVSTSFLITHAQLNERTFELLNDEGAFPRLIRLISSPKQHGHEGIHRLLMELLYEMSRIQRIKIGDLAHVDDDFIKMLFEIIEQVSDDVNDPYHYPTIRVLLVLNEQFMVAAHDPANGQAAVPLTNKVIKVLSAHGSEYKTFGENIILLLNREDETSLQLLTLKLLYLLFTTPPTYEYFYTNDLRVLVDILIRNLLDLPEEASSLRHTYLRVLYPLLEHTQLQHPPHYKRDEIRKLLVVLGGGQLHDPNGSHEGLQHWGHFDAVDETTKRLVKRCEGVSWLIDPEIEPPVHAESPTDDGASDLSSPTSPSKAHPPALPAPRKLKKRNSSKGSTLTIGQYLTPRLEGARQSSLSMMEVAAQKEKPGVITPSRNPGLKNNLRAAIMQKKEKPPPPQARRSGLSRMRMERMESDAEMAKTEVQKTEVQKTEVQKTEPAPNVEGEDHTQTNNHHHRHPPIPFHHHHHHHHNHGATSPPPALEEKDKDKAEPPPVPSHHKGHHLGHHFGKKPPPAPKARRRRGREGSGDSTREPGKFSSNLPSIVTTTTAGERIIEANPFSPVDKTFSPPEPDSASTIDSRMKLPVSEALEQAQAMALAEIEETLEHVEIEEELEEETEEDIAGEEGKTESPTVEEIQKNDAAAGTSHELPQEEDGADNKHDQPGISRAHSQEEIDQQFHDAVPDQPLSQSQTLSPTPSHLLVQSQTLSPYPTADEMATPPESMTPSVTLTTMTTGMTGPGTSAMAVQQSQTQQMAQMPRMVLTPPAQEPSRGVPGPQYELERSPFLTDEEVEEEETDQDQMDEDEGRR
ncbi:uncharacterized protein Z520_01621 [Fonsecaea multimorphosa CBS 102226]|uniref:SPIN90/Ldb17 leucine-rich domain-containing protein n=1 Tax=Fonsecaea multimorphosa CBS 102226 TaxID=1442371 RepID=A0A0D2L257_9EURO|nr:uncharacterized protein Z520_01621 [Fonsecaea multimorphosa CBS 102226]KIY03154.1 hypothetical protein Z520_01621 [Fonsecaea multimorphosa CBS 102226]OAL30399.1 hypothetical protein AYO22_01597 [Fonsecaea multimorphosa]